MTEPRIETVKARRSKSSDTHSCADGETTAPGEELAPLDFLRRQIALEESADSNLTSYWSASARE